MLCHNDTHWRLIMATALPRITARVDAETQDLLAQAAAIAGMTSINSFVLNAAIDKTSKSWNVKEH